MPIQWQNDDQIKMLNGEMIMHWQIDNQMTKKKIKGENHDPIINYKSDNAMTKWWHNDNKMSISKL
jgi:hypothetical protein